MTRPDVGVLGVSVDLDDTLFPQAAWLSGAWDVVAAAGGTLGMPPLALRDALGAVAAEGSDRGGIIDRAVACVGGPRRLVPALVEAFRSHRPGRLECYPGAREALAALRAVVPVACVTDGDPSIQRGKLAALGLTEAFDAVVVSDELGGRAARKPDPASFLAAYAAIGVDPAGCVHVGDRPSKDVLGALRVGARPVRVLTGEYSATPDDPSAAPWWVLPSAADALVVLRTVVGDGAAPGRTAGEHRVVAPG